MICLSESYLDSSVSSDNNSLHIKDYKILRADQPRNVKRGGVCVYFKESRFWSGFYRGFWSASKATMKMLPPNNLFKT